MSFFYSGLVFQASKWDFIPMVKILLPLDLDSNPNQKIKNEKDIIRFGDVPVFLGSFCPRKNLQRQL
jgi:hypothetical protein